MPFGLTRAPRTFQKAIDNLFSNVIFVKVYLDDIIVHSYDLETHLENITAVLDRLNKNKIKINTENVNS